MFFFLLTYAMYHTDPTEDSPGTHSLNQNVLQPEIVNLLSSKLYIYTIFLCTYYYGCAYYRLSHIFHMFLAQ